MPQSQALVAETGMQPQRDEVIQPFTRQGHPRPQAQTPLPVQALEGAQGPGTVLIGHETHIVNGGHPPSIEGFGGLLIGL